MKTITWPTDLRERQFHDCNNLKIVVTLSHLDYIALNHIVSSTQEFGRELRRHDRIHNSLYLKYQADIWDSLSWDIAWAAGNKKVRTVVDQQLIDQLNKIWRTQRLLIPFVFTSEIDNSPAPASISSNLSDHQASTNSTKLASTFSVPASASRAIIDNKSPYDNNEQAALRDAYSTSGKDLDHRISTSVRDPTVPRPTKASAAKTTIDRRVSYDPRVQAAPYRPEFLGPYLHHPTHERRSNALLKRVLGSIRFYLLIIFTMLCVAWGPIVLSLSFRLWTAVGTIFGFIFKSTKWLLAIWSLIFLSNKSGQLPESFHSHASSKETCKTSIITETIRETVTKTQTKNKIPTSVCVSPTSLSDFNFPVLPGSMSLIDQDPMPSIVYTEHSQISSEHITLAPPSHNWPPPSPISFEHIPKTFNTVTRTSTESTPPASVCAVQSFSPGFFFPVASVSTTSVGADPINRVPFSDHSQVFSEQLTLPSSPQNRPPAIRNHLEDSSKRSSTESLSELAADFPDSWIIGLVVIGIMCFLFKLCCWSNNEKTGSKLQGMLLRFSSLFFISWLTQSSKPALRTRNLRPLSKMTM